jgi:membrane protease YdiL (CAAX protease family)
MKSYLRINSPGAQLVLFMGLLLACFVAGSAVIAGVLLAKGIITVGQTNIDLNNPHFISTLKVMQSVYTVICFLLPALLFAWINFRYKQLYFLGFRRSEKISLYLFAILLMFVSFPLASWFGELNEHIPLSKWMVDAEKEASQQMESFLKSNSAKDVIINLLVIGLIPAICEEACFRGTLQRILIHVFKNPWAGIIVTAIFFSAFHMQFEGFLPRMFLGVLLGALYWYSNSLWVSIAAHFFNNGAQLLLVFYNPKLISENPSVPLYAAIASALIVLGLLMLIQQQSRVTYQAVYEFEHGEGEL